MGFCSLFSTTLLLSLFLVNGLWGHGRVQTSVLADVGRDKTVVDIRLAFPDLISAMGMDLREDLEDLIDAKERREMVLEKRQEFSELFRVIDSNGQSILADGVWMALPDFENASYRNLGIEQQTIQVSIQYSYAEPPESLTFWCDFGVDHHGGYVMADLTLKREGDLLLLPAQIGPMMPLRYAFDWSEPVLQIAEMADLRQATVSWGNRPVKALLDTSRKGARFLLFAPVLALPGRAELIGGVTGLEGKERRRYLDELGGGLAADISLVRCGVQLKARSYSCDVYPLSATQFERGPSRIAFPLEESLFVLEVVFQQGGDASAPYSLDCSRLIGSGGELLLEHREKSGARSMTLLTDLEDSITFGKADKRLALANPPTTEIN